MTAVRDRRSVAEQRRRDAALTRVIARIADQFPELGSAQVLEAVLGSYAVAAVTTGPDAVPVPARAFRA